MSMIKKDTDLPIRSEYIVLAEFIEQTGASQTLLDELMEMGWVIPRRTGDASCLFRSLDVYRVRKLGRICYDFELPTLGGTIIVDLLERIAILERKLDALQGSTLR